MADVRHLQQRQVEERGFMWWSVDKEDVPEWEGGWAGLCVLLADRSPLWVAGCGRRRHRHRRRWTRLEDWLSLSGDGTYVDAQVATYSSSYWGPE